MAGDHGGSVFDRRVARLKRRAAFLRERVKARGGGDKTARDTAEAVAIEWAVAELERAQSAEHRTTEAIALIMRYGGYDGAHHKTWVLDQTVRLLAAERYADVVKSAKAGEDGPDTYSWEEGIPP